MSGTTVVAGGTVVTPGGEHRADVRIAGDRIEAVGDVDPAADRTVAATDRYVLPGLVDFHGDDIESHRYPRDGAEVDRALALDACDRANLAAGVTTKCHALAFETDPEKHRSPSAALAEAEAIDHADRLRVDHRVHARCDLADDESLAAVERALDVASVDVVTLDAAVPGTGQFADAEALADWYEGHDGNARRADRPPAALRERARTDPLLVGDALDGRIDRVAAAADAAGATLCAHDPESATEVTGLAGHGVTVSEYPVTLEAAERAREEGVTTAMGAPNLVRGGSLFGNLDALAAARRGVLDVLCADYHPPSLLAAPFVDTGEPLHERVARVTAAPADAVGLDDRGRLEPGARADLVVVDPDPVPSAETVFVGGRLAAALPRGVAR